MATPSAASSSSSSSAGGDARTLEQLAKENAELQREIATIRASLGLDVKEEAEEKARILAVFKKYDADNSGTIDRKEFDGVAYDAGYDPSGLDEKGVSKIWDEIKPATPTAITFEEFYRWFKASAGTATKSKTYQLGHVVRLQAKSLGASVAGASGALKTAKARLALPRAVGAAAPRSEIKSTFGETREGVRIKLQVGDFTDVGFGVAFHTKSDAEGVAALRTAVGVPEGKTAFAFVDFGIATGADEAQLGELAGVLEGMIGMVGGGLNEKAGMPIYHSHSVKITTDKEGNKVLRAALFAETNPIDLAAAATGQDPSTFSPAGLLDLRVAFESPLSVANLREPAFLLTPAQVRARLTIDGSISSTLEKRVTTVITTMGLPSKTAAIAAAANFFKGLNIDVQTIGLDEFVAKFAGSERGVGATLALYAAQMSAMPINPLLRGLNVPEMLGEMLPPEIAPILENATKNLTGPRRVHVQLDDVEFVVNFTGIDVFTLLASLKTAE
jgi:hypothetical protein